MDEGARITLATAQRERQLQTDDDFDISGNREMNAREKRRSGRTSAPGRNLTGFKSPTKTRLAALAL